MGTIHLICEADTDAKIVQAILNKKGFRVKVERIGHKQGGLSRMVKDIEVFIKTAIEKRQTGDCIAVLHDIDTHTEPDRRGYIHIETVCERYRKDVVRIPAYNAIEAWLLADEGIAHWLSHPNKPKPDQISDPKEHLNKLVKARTGRDHTGVIRAEVLSHLDRTGDKHSDSLREALDHLKNAPCVR